MELDCSEPMAKLVSKEVDRSVHGPLVEDIRSRLKGFDNFAMDGYQNKLCKSWVFVPLGYVKNFYASDCSSD
jgi:hypothetical protein